MRRTLAVLIPVLLLAAVVPGLPDARAQTGTSSLEGIVCPTGEVYALEKGQECSLRGVPDAVVRIQRTGVVGPVGGVDRSATTDADGRYALTGLDDGTYNVTVTRTGFAPLARDVAVEGPVWQDLRIEPQEVALRGRVVDEAGNGVGGVRLALYGSYGAREPEVAVGDDGGFAARLLAGHYEAQADAPGFYPTYQTVFVDGAQDVRITMERVPPQTAKVLGTVRDQDGAPVADAEVRVYQCCGHAEPYGGAGDAAMTRPYYGGENRTATDAQGRYEIHVDAGEVSLTVGREGYTYANEYLTVQEGEAARRDVQLTKYPEKTARLVGEVRDAATGERLPFVSISVQSPALGLYECSRLPSEARPMPAEDADAAEPARGEATMIAPSPYPYDSGCAIEVDDEGGFEGMVTPGYAIVSVHFQHWMTCAPTDDGSRSQCGPEYFEWVRSLVLPEDGTTRLVVELARRPGPDATVSGYVVSDGSGEALPGARVEFNNLETWAWGSAATDEDGSYGLRLRSGVHRVTVWAEGHLHWEGIVEVRAGAATPLDVHLTPGEESYGGCCWAYPATMVAEDGAAAPAPRPASGPDSADGGAGAPSGERAALAGDDEDVQQGVQYEDLGGGLGPYDADERSRVLESGATEDAEDTPGVGAAALLLAVLAALVLVRRRTA